MSRRKGKAGPQQALTLDPKPAHAWLGSGSDGLFLRVEQSLSSVTLNGVTYTQTQEVLRIEISRAQALRWAQTILSHIALQDAGKGAREP